MTLFVLDLNDAELRMSREGAIVARSRGFALIDQDELLLGDAAVRQFRLHPRQANNLFWHRLNSETLSHRGKDVANHADLVYRHLRALTETAKFTADDELIIAAPATTSTDQLGLLLGIAQQLGLKVAGLVDAGVAAAATTQTPERFSFIDVSLHRMSVTQIASAEQLQRTGSVEVNEVSLSALLEAWVNVIADRFVRETRFDPLANAATEQQVYNQVFDWLAAATTAPELAIEVGHGANARRIDVPAGVLIDKAANRYRLTETVLDGPLLLSHRAAALPGFVAALRTRVEQVTVCEPNAIFAGVVLNSNAIRSSGDGLRFVTRLPSAGVSRPVAPAQTLPTHVLWGHRAVPINAGITIGRDAFPDLPATFPDSAVAIARSADAVRLSVAAGTALAVDGAPARDGAELRCGSAIELAGVRFALIEVANGA
ncbi:MAG: hypothetical protein HC809_11430 [Gammaproteobacteria bacterium]|nr:hypothetical protein [Gammaproteobacteria bacterium]